ncbi:MAG: MFS transporter [Rickettsiaceae bacterium]
MTKKDFFLTVFTVFVQYYDYHLFGFLAASIAVHFFPADQIITQLLKTYFIMGVAMLAKPIGAIILGKIGDKQGRSTSFKISLIGTAAASFILFVTPSYHSIGMLAAFILLLCRMIICSCVSSGSDGVRLYIFEHISVNRRGIGIGLTTFFTQAGSLAAALSAWFFTQTFLPHYSWKLAFLIGGVLGVVLLIIMQINTFSDTKPIQDTKDFKKFNNISLIDIITNNWQLFVMCILLAGSIGSTTQFLIMFFGTYNFKILAIIERSLMYKYISLAIIGYMIFAVVGGYLADKFGRFRVISVGVILVLVLSMVSCYQISCNNFNFLTFFTIVSGTALITIPAASIYKQSIPVAIRYRVFSLSHAIGSIVVSAPTAFLSTLIYHKTNINWLPIGYFIITIIMIFWTVYYLRQKQIAD